MSCVKCHMWTPVLCHVSGFIRHMSFVRCHVSHITCNNYYYYFLSYFSSSSLDKEVTLIGEGSVINWNTQSRKQTRCSRGCSWNDMETLFSNTEAMFVEPDMVNCFCWEDKDIVFFNVSNRYLCPSTTFSFLDRILNQFYLDFPDLWRLCLASTNICLKASYQTCTCFKLHNRFLFDKTDPLFYQTRHPPCYMFA